MNTSDRLIEYYFQRLVKGMSDSEIQKSLGEQFMEEGERELIFKHVKFKEGLYNKKLARQRLGRVVMFVGLGLLVLGFILFALQHFHYRFVYSAIIMYSLITLGFVLSCGGLLAHKR